MKNKIREFDNQINILNKESNQLEEKLGALHREKEKLQSQLIFEEKIFQDSIWTLDIRTNCPHRLSLSLNENENILKFFRETLLIKNNTWFELAPGIHLSLDSFSIDLQFDENKQIMPFVRKNNIKLNGSGVTDHLSKLKREVAALEALCHQFNI